MPRVQVQYQGRGEQTQAVSAETIRPIQARFDPNDSGAFQLAKALGALNTEGLSQQVGAINAAQAADDRRAAEAYANGVTVEELGKQIKDGSLLPSHSPTFIAALQHIHGENTQASGERDTLSKIQSGELRFGSQEEMDKYLTDNRNKALAGQSEYTVAGYDKGYNSFRDKAISANTQVVNAEAVEQGVSQASDNLGNVLLQVTQPDFKGDPAQALVDRYQLLRKTSLLRNDAAKEALGGLLTSVASSGNQDLTNALLDKKLDNGITVRAALGDIKAATLVQHSEVQNDKLQRQRVDVEVRPFLDQSDKGELDEKGFNDWVTKNERYINSSTVHQITNANQAAQFRARVALDKAKLIAMAEQSQTIAQQNISVAVANGALPFLPQQQVISPTGERKDFDTEKAAQQAIQDKVTREKLDVSSATKVWASNNVVNPEWQKVVQAGAANIASVGWNYDGKNIGQLNDQGKASIETFIRINATNPEYAEKLAGKDYHLLDDIQFAMSEKGGFGDVSTAAAFVNQMNHSGVSSGDYGSMTKNVASAVSDVVNPGFWSGKVAWVNGLFGNDQVNLTAVESTVRRRAEMLVKSGQVPDAKAAVKATVEYLANPNVSTKINNTLYFNKDLPTVPKGEEPGKWMERFIKEVPGDLAKSQKLSEKDVRLEPNSYGGFTAWTGGVPLVDPKGNVVSYRKDEISKWIDSTMREDRHFESSYTNFQRRFEKPLGPELRRGITENDMYLKGNMLSREGFKKILKDGNDTKPISELFKIYQPQFQKLN